MSAVKNMNALHGLLTASGGLPAAAVAVVVVMASAADIGCTDSTSHRCKACGNQGLTSAISNAFG